MDVPEPRVRRRGFFFHVETPELDEHDAAEGISIRLGSTRKPTHAIRTTSLSQTQEIIEKGRGSSVRSASETGSHRQARMSR